MGLYGSSKEHSPFFQAIPHVRISAGMGDALFWGTQNHPVRKVFFMKVSLFRNLPVNLENEVIETLFETKNITIERIISRAHASPEGFWYDQDRNEFVLLVQGRAGLRFQYPEILVILEPGDYLHIPAHAKHRVDWTDPETETLWLAVHY